MTYDYPNPDAPSDLSAALAAYAGKLATIMAFPADDEGAEQRAYFVESLVRAAGLSAPVLRRAREINDLDKIPGGRLTPYQAEILLREAEESPLAQEGPPVYAP